MVASAGCSGRPVTGARSDRQCSGFSRSRRRTGSGIHQFQRPSQETVAGTSAPGAASVGRRPGGGRGIAGMRERAALLGGTLVAGPEGSAGSSGSSEGRAPGGTFRVHAVLPYDRRAA